MLRLRVLGGFALEGSGGTPAAALSHRRAMAVLAVLAVCGDLGCTRERLLALLWPESDEAHARHGLRDALHAIRHALPPESISSIASLLRLDSSVVCSDVLEFSQAVASGRLTDAIPAYGGPLLDGFHVDGAPEFEHWLSGERARLERECVEALEELATSAERTGAWAEAARWWGRALEHDPLNSRFVLQQMQALAAVVDRANAIQVGEHHVLRLRQEFGLEPDPAVRAMIGRIQRGELPAAQDGGLRRTPAPQVERPPSLAPPSASSDASTAIATPLTATGRRVPRWVPWLAGVAVVAVLGAALAMRRSLRPPAPPVHAPRTAIAVLPFHSLGGDSSHASFAGGLHDELLTQLGKVASLRVVGRVSVGEYQQTV
jgi:DNA-binding SARP family transcriptional activator